MEVLTFVSPRLMDERCYLVTDPDSGQALVIDPDRVEDRITEVLQERNGRLALILLTHGHFDHIGSVAELRTLTGAPVAIHEGDAAMLMDARQNLSGYFGTASFQCPADRLLRDGECVDFTGHSLEVLHTPGHTPGSCCFLLGDWLFTGDTLFTGSVGRTDFPGGSTGELMASIHGRLLTLPDRITVYPGHGEPTTIGRERLSNPYLQDSWGAP